MDIDELINNYKSELRTIEQQISQASGSDLLILKDKQQQYIAKISELTVQREVSKYGTRPTSTRPTVITVPIST